MGEGGISCVTSLLENTKRDWRGHENLQFYSLTQEPDPWFSSQWKQSVTGGKRVFILMKIWF